MADVDIEELATLGGDEDARAGRLLQAHVQRVVKATAPESWASSTERDGGTGGSSGDGAATGAATDAFVPGMQRIWVKTFGCRCGKWLLTCEVMHVFSWSCHQKQASFL